MGVAVVGGGGGGVIGKTWTGTFGVLVNAVDPDQTPQNTASDQDMHCLLKLLELKETV